MFPIQPDLNYMTFPKTVAMKHAEAAYDFYAKIFGTMQSLERIGQRGGFGVVEFSCLLQGLNPGRVHGADAAPIVAAALKILNDVL